MTDDELIDSIGSRVRNRITGIEGEVQAVAFYEKGRQSIMITPEAMPGTEGIKYSGHTTLWLDFDRIVFQD